MTRKCVMCKSKNYKNSHSFFSAPKDSETRRLWEEAININNYTVNEDTYVCSKHFKKEDIITHWVSGVPPQVITIKYKKCRLRPGAVPIPLNSVNNSVLDTTFEPENNGIILDGKKYFIASKKKDLDTSNKMHKTEEALNESLNCNLEDEIYEYIPEDLQEPEESDIEMNSRSSKKIKLIDTNIENKEDIVYTANQNQEILVINCSNIQVNNTELEGEKNEHFDNLRNTGTILTYFPKKTYIKVKEKKIQKNVHSNIINENSNQIIGPPLNWQDDPINEKFDIHDIDRLNENLNKTDFEHVINPTQEIIYCDNTMSFDDFLEIYNEVSLPSSWFASLIIKGDDTTIVYYCMNISSTGMPYVEKKAFLNNDMILRCGVFNKEINVATFRKNEENLMIHTLSDIEEFIKEFNQIPICPGILGEKFLDNKNTAVITLDGSTWRHSQCSIILNDHNQITCLQCASLMKKKKS